MNWKELVFIYLKSIVEVKYLWYLLSYYEEYEVIV